MTAIHRNVIVCGSPSCSASFGVSPFREPGDDRARPYCPRCAQS